MPRPYNRTAPNEPQEIISAGRLSNAQIERCLDALTDSRLRLVLERRIGWNERAKACTERPRTFRELADYFGVSIVRISQWEDRAIDKSCLRCPHRLDGPPQPINGELTPNLLEALN